MVRTCWVAFTLLLSSGSAFAQAYSPPRTLDGRPDLHGVWGTSFVTPVERPDSAKTLVPDEAQVKALIAELTDLGPIGDPDIQHQGVSELAVVNGQKRTSIIAHPADGRLPFTEKGRKLADRGYWLDQNGFDNPEERPGFERCISGFGQPPIRQIPLTIVTQIVQTRDAFAFNTEDVQGFRLVHLDRPPSPRDLPTLNGYSSGRWEGDTLVIETTRTRADDPYRGHFGRAIVVEPDSTIVEKLTRLSGSELLYQFTVQDADLYTGPWLGEYVFKLLDDAALEYACHEANYSMVNMLKSGRVADERAAAAKKKPKGKR